MTRRRSGYDVRPLMLRELREQLPLIFLSLVAMLTMPAKCFLQAQQIEQDYADIDSFIMLAYADVSTYIVIAAMAVLTAMVLFHYLHNAQQTNFYHSQPMKRQTMFWSRFLTGLAILIPTYLIGAALTYACCMTIDAGATAVPRVFGEKLLIELALMLIVYAASVLSCVLSGSAVVALILTVGIQYGAMLLWLCGLIIVDWFYPAKLLLISDFEYGFLSPIYNTLTRFALTPDYSTDLHDYNTDLTDGMFYSREALYCAIAYLLAAVIITLLAVGLYRLRKSERTGKAMAFPVLRTPIKYIAMTICAVICAAWMFKMTDMKLTFYLGLAIGMFAAHFILEIMFARSLRAMFSHQLSLWIYVIAACACVVLLRLDVTGFNTELPDRTDIVAANVFSDEKALSCTYVENQDGTIKSSRWIYDKLTEDMLAERENVDAIYAMAQRGAASMREYRFGITENERYNIAFTLSDGSVFVRSYYLGSSDLGSEEMQVLTERASDVRFSGEYLGTRTSAANVDASQTSSILVVNGSQIYDGGTTIDDPEVIAQLLESIKNESQTLTKKYVTHHLPVMVLHVNGAGAERAQNASYLGNIIDTQLECIKSDDYNIPLYACEKNTVKLLQAQGIKVARYDYGDIDRITFDVSEAETESYGNMLRDSVTVSWSGKVNDADDFEYVLSGSAADAIWECCDPAAYNMRDDSCYMYIDAKDYSCSVSYMSGSAPSGLNRFKIQDDSETSDTE